MRLDLLSPGNGPVCLIAGGWGAEPGMQSVLSRFAAEAAARHRAVALLWDAAADEAGEDDALQHRLAGQPVEIAAWSFGVRLGLEYAARRHLNIVRFAAVAGTPRPIDRREGIPPVIFDATLSGLDEQKRLAFWRNLSGRPDAQLPTGISRPVDAWRRELLAVKALPAAPSPEAQALLAKLVAEKAILALVPERDRIVPPAAQRRAWAAAGVPTADLPGEPHLPSEASLLSCAALSSLRTRSRTASA